MDILREIERKIAEGLYEYSQHLIDRATLRNIDLDEVFEALESVELIEDYPDDKYWPSLLVLGFTHTDRALHVQCSYPSRELVKIITTYEPDTLEWELLRFRKPK